MREVAADHRAQAVWLSVGSEFAHWPSVDGRYFHDIPAAERWTVERVAAVGVWTRRDMLIVMPHGARHSIWLMFTDGVHDGYYVNLEDPITRWSSESVDYLDTRDHQLDVVIGADRSSWAWKDEDDLAAAVDRGWFTVDEAAAFYAEGRRVVEQAQRGAFPFDGSWTTFRPPSSWTPLELPTGAEAEPSG